MAKILLVEDNEMNRDMLSRRLKRRGFEVIIAVDGAIGVELAQSEHPNLILMDMSLPVLDGWEATKQLKAIPDVASIPVIALTAHAMVGDREQALQAGCDDYDTKPVEIKRLLGKIETLLNSAQQTVDKAPVQELNSSIVESSVEPVSTVSAGENSTPEPVVEIPPKPQAPINPDTIPILVVDDNHMNREVLGRRLGKSGYQIHFAETGEEALNLLVSETIALVLLDIMMPGIGGWETLRRIRLQYPATELPVIMVTAKDQSEDIVKAFSFGANDYITKPIDFPITLARVQSQLQLLKISQSSQPLDISVEKKEDDHSNKVTRPDVGEKAVVSPPIQAVSFPEKESRSLFQVLSPAGTTVKTSSSSSDLLNNQYKIFEQLNKTPYHQTFLAYDTHQSTEHVVSILRISFPGSNLNSLILSKFQQEIEQCGVIFTRESPGMLKLLQTFVQGNHVYLIQEYVEGSLLSTEIKLGRPHTPLYAINVLGRLLEILSVLHKNNFELQGFSTHSFTRRQCDGEIILTDLGISERLHRIFKQFNSGTGRADTFPSQSSKFTDFTKDLYTVGSIAIQSLTGVAPKEFDGIDAEKGFEWQTDFDLNSKCADFINRLIHPDKTKHFKDATQAYRELLMSHLQLHAVKHNMKRTGQYSGSLLSE